MLEGAVVDSKYQVVRQLGQGGMGAVYEAHHLGTGRRVALKVINPEALESGGDVITRFQREARASGAIDSLHVVQVLDSGVDPTSKSPYLVMELLVGEDLLGLIDRLGPLPIELALRIVAQACVGLARAHAAGIVHRDIKAANIFVARRDEEALGVKILDFGIAKVRSDPMHASSAAMTQTGTMLGSPLYMSPEQVVGNKAIDARTDIYSLGVTLYEALSGTTPLHDIESMGALVLAICSGRAEALTSRAPWVPAAVAAIVTRAMALEPAARFSSADEMRAAILALLPQGSTALHASMLVRNEQAAVRSARVDTGATPQDVAAAADRFLAGAAGPPGPSHTAIRRERSAWMIVAPAAIFFAVVGLALGAFALFHHRADPDPSIDPVTSAGIVTLPPPPRPTASEVPSAVPSASTAPSAGASASASAKPALKPPPPLPSKKSCNPNYYFDSNGVKHFKEECF